jgi:hypothetical protein
MNVVVGLLGTVGLIVAIAVILDQLIVFGPDWVELRRQTRMYKREDHELKRLNARLQWKATK